MAMPLVFERMLALGNRLERIRKEQEEASKEMHAVIVEAHAEGWSVSSIARTIHVSRQTVYTALEQERAK